MVNQRYIYKKWRGLVDECIQFTVSAFFSTKIGMNDPTYVQPNNCYQSGKPVKKVKARKPVHA
jgi:hypothetical protein